jgi:hypothetical protein
MTMSFQTTTTAAAAAVVVVVVTWLGHEAMS